MSTSGDNKVHSRVDSDLTNSVSAPHLLQMCVQEQSLGGPRIKHVCRAAAVALGQPRAMVPDDIPRLSALPLHEREGISFSPTVEGRQNSNESHLFLKQRSSNFRLDLCEKEQHGSTFIGLLCARGYLF